MWFGTDRGGFVVVKEETVSETVKAVDVNWISGKVTVYPAHGEQTIVKQRGAENFPDDQKFSLTVQDGTLTVRDMRGRGWNIFSFGRRAGDLELYLPQKIYDSITFIGTSCDITAKSGLQAGQARVKTVSGDIGLSGEFDSLWVNTTSGEIRIPGCQVKGGMSAGSVSGDMDLTGVKANSEIRVETTSGRVRAKDVQTENAVLRSVSGDLEISGSVERVNMHSTSGSLSVAGGEGLRSVDASSTSGSLTVFAADRGFTARFDKVSGSFSCAYPTTQNGSEYTYPGKTGEMASYHFSTTSGSFRIEKQ